MTSHKTGIPEEWLTARLELLKAETRPSFLKNQTYHHAVLRALNQAAAHRAQSANIRHGR